MNVRKKLSLAALCFTLPAMASAQAAAAPAPAAEPAAAPAKAAAPAMEVKAYGFALVTYNMQTGVFAYPEYPAKISAEKVGTAPDDVTYKSNSISARQSRFGFMINNADPGVLGLKLGGKIEADFMGGAATATTIKDCTPVAPATSCSVASTSTPAGWDSSILRLRYAYGQASYAIEGAGKVTATLGQTDGLVATLHPELGAYIALPTFLLAGNLTRRSPQIRLGYDQDFGVVAASLEVAALSAVDKGGSNIYYTAGNNANQPDIEVRAQAVVKPIPDVKATIGVGYHTNKQTYNQGKATEQSLTSTLFGVDVNVEATKYLNIRGEFFQGKGSDEGQTGAFADLDPAKSVAGKYELLKTTGFWAQAVVKPLPYLWIMGGYGQTTASTDYGDPKYTMMNVGVLSNVSKNLRLGLEYTTSTAAQDAYTKVGATTATPKVDLSGSAIAFSSRFSF